MKTKKVYIIQAALIFLIEILITEETTAQGVLSVSPAQNALNVPRNTTITATFNEAMDTSTFTNSNIRMWGNQTGFHVSTFSYDSTAYTLIIDPSVDFLPGEVVTISLANNIHSASGQPIAKFVWNFTIGVTPSSGKFLSKTIPVPALDCGTMFFASADLNLDGKIDFVEFESGFRCGALHVLMNNGDGTFQVKNGPTPIGDYINIALADFTGDGYTDLAMTSSLYGNASVGVWKNNGDGTFEGVGGGSAGSAGFITTGDFDGDGDIDIATPGNGVSILKNNGNGTFQPAVSSPVNRQPYKLTTADVDRDGAIDLICFLDEVSLGSDGISFLKNNGDGSFQQQGSFEIDGNDGTSLVAADFDGDGAIDLAAEVFPGSYPYSTRIFKNNGDGTFQLLHSYAGAYAPIVAGDLDGDNDIDLWVAGFILMNNGEGVFQQEGPYNAGGYPAPCDIDGDGDMDLVGAGGGELFILKNRALLSAAIDSLIFKPVYLGSVGDSSFTLNNFSISPIEVTNVTSTNANFSILNGKSFTIAGGDSHIVVVRYTPTSVQSDTGTLYIYPEGYPVEKISLSGTGKTPIAIINVSPTSLSFSSTTLGTISDMILNIQNIGQAPLIISNITHLSPHFQVLSPVAISIPPNDVYPIAINFTPNALGSVSDTLKIYTNDSTNNPLSVSMTGSGTSVALPEISVSPLRFVFDTVTVGQSDSLTLGIDNIGAATLNVTSMSTTNTVFTVSISGLTLEPNERSPRVWVRFTPTQSGKQEGMLTIMSNDLNENPLDIRMVGIGRIVVGVDTKENHFPKNYFLSQNYPNPFNPITAISFGLPKRSLVALKVYNLMGQEVAVLVDAEMQAGFYQVPFSADRLGSGVYFYQIRAGQFTETKKLIFIR
ncbi:MAG: VCBS repeat-containing protein [Ignavibacteriae bacterium]|nr:VCBS repeat-containing protein [Ignavibacteriota bacterium]